MIRSKELEVLLSRARAAEQKQLAESEKLRAEKAEEESQTSRKQLEAAQNGQTMLIDKLIACCKEVCTLRRSVVLCGFVWIMVYLCADRYWTNSLMRSGRSGYSRLCVSMDYVSSPSMTYQCCLCPRTNRDT